MALLVWHGKEGKRCIDRRKWEPALDFRYTIHPQFAEQHVIGTKREVSIVEVAFVPYDSTPTHFAGRIRQEAFSIKLEPFK